MQGQMFVPITIMLIAAVAGSLLRKVEAVHRCGSAIKYMVWFLLFVLGLSAGMNDDIVYGFAHGRGDDCRLGGLQTVFQKP